MEARRQFAMGLGLLLVAASAFPKTAVTAVRFWNLSDSTRVVIETTGPFEFTSDRAVNPDRIFFDLTGAVPNFGTKRLYTVTVDDGRVKQIRVAQTSPGVTRVVFDVVAELEFTASRLTNPDRLIVQLQPRAVTLPPATIPAPVMTQPPVPSRSQAAANSAPVSTTLPSSQMPAPPPAKAAKIPATVASAPKPQMPAPPPARPARIEGDLQSMTRVLGLKVGRIVIDAGHGGHDTGTAGPGGLLEKDLVLDVARRVGELIQKRLGAEVIYTREDDTFIALERRTEIANDHRADLFLSIHANSSPASNSSGVETYFLNFTTDKAALAVAARENASSQKTVYELRDLVQKITLQDKIEESRQFAAKVQQSIYTASVRSNSRTRNRGIKAAPFVVLIGASMPSVLTEIGFVSNPRDEALFKRPDFRQKLAEGVYRGIQQYASTLSHFKIAQK